METTILRSYGATKTDSGGMLVKLRPSTTAGPRKELLNPEGVVFSSVKTSSYIFWEMTGNPSCRKQRTKGMTDIVTSMLVERPLALPRSPAKRTS